MPPKKPIMIAAQDVTTEQPAVTETKPDRQPFIAYCRLNEISPVNLSDMIVLRNNAAMQPAAALKVVLTAV